MFTTEQIEALSAKLDRRHVKTRQQAGRSLSYIEGWQAIAEANRIFGFGWWDRETVDLRPVFEPIQVKDRNGNDQWRVGYMARVRIEVRPPAVQEESKWARVVREGCGYGSGIAKDLGDAHESAIKEAETDAMKRALMTFGNPFGLALYDKEQANVGTNGTGSSAGSERRAPNAKAAGSSPAPSATLSDWKTLFHDLLKGAEKQETVAHVNEYWAAQEDDLVRLGEHAPDLYKTLVDRVKKHRAKLAQAPVT